MGNILSGIFSNIQIPISLIITLYSCAVILVAVYIVLGRSFTDKRWRTEEDWIQTFIRQREELMDAHGIHFMKGYFILMAVTPLVLGMIFLVVTKGSYISIVFGLMGLAFPEIILRLMILRSNRNFEDRFSRSLEQLSSSLRAGMSIAQAVEDVANCRFLHDSMRKRFANVSADLAMGVSVSDAFYKFAEETGSSDARDVAIAIDVQNEVGGHEAEVVQEIATNIHDRIMLRREVKSIFSGTSSMVWMMDFIPIGVVAFFSITNRSYVNVYFENILYTALFAGLIVFMIIGSVINHFVMNRISKGA